MLPKTLRTIYIHILASSIPQLSPHVFQVSDRTGRWCSPAAHSWPPPAPAPRSSAPWRRCSTAQLRRWATTWGTGVEIPWIWPKKGGKGWVRRWSNSQRSWKQLVLTLQKKWSKHQRVQPSKKVGSNPPSKMIQQIMLPERHQHMAGEAGMVQESQAVGQHAAEDQKAPGWRLGKMMKNGCQELPRIAKKGDPFIRDPCILRFLEMKNLHNFDENGG